MILIDGQPGDSVPVDDRGFAYGDGAFETLRVNQGRAPWLDRHLARLEQTCRTLGFTMPDARSLAHELELVARGSDRAVVKIVVSRGSGGRGYGSAPAMRPRRVVSCHDWPAHPVSNWERGVRVRSCTTRLASHAVVPGAKHLNRLPQVLARREWDDADIAEGLLRDETGAVIEGTMSNLFLVRAGGLVTPAITGGGVAGIARGWIMERAGRLATGVVEGRIDDAAIAQAQEIFLCNSVVGIWPVRELDGRPLTVGPTTRRCQVALTAEGFGS